MYFRHFVENPCSSKYMSGKGQLNGTFSIFVYKFCFRHIDIFRFQFWYNSRKSLDRKHSNLKLIAAVRIPMHWGKRERKSRFSKQNFAV